MGKAQRSMLKTKTGPNKKSNTLSIHIVMSPAKITAVYDTYWRFATLRQQVFFNRFFDKAYPWSSDTTLSKFKFTNVYRATDRVSQYLIREVIYNDTLPSSPKEVFFRILLFKLFNKIETWEMLKRELGPITFESYKFKNYERVLSAAMNAKKTIYSAAYIMPSAKSTFGYSRKHSNHLKLIELMIKQDAHKRMADAKTMQEAFEILKSYPSLGDFLAYQFLIDINYSSVINFSESDFVVAGPGAKGGISKCFSDRAGLSEVEIIKLMTDRQEIEFERLNLPFQTLWGRRLQLIDCQNVFCEVDKYARVNHPEIKGDSDRTRIKQIFRINKEEIAYWFPPKWGINEMVRMSTENRVLPAAIEMAI